MEDMRVRLPTKTILFNSKSQLFMEEKKAQCHGTSEQDMKMFLQGLQTLQQRDNWEHGVELTTRTCDSEDGKYTVIEGRFTSNIDKDEDGAGHYYRVRIDSDYPLRANNAEYEKFKQLLQTDK